jgi:hypothetical protein
MIQDRVRREVVERKIITVYRNLSDAESEQNGIELDLKEIYEEFRVLSPADKRWRAWKNYLIYRMILAKRKKAEG